MAIDPFVLKMPLRKSHGVIKALSIANFHEAAAIEATNVPIPPAEPTQPNVTVDLAELEAAEDAA
jgi:hypothetical protein